MFIPLRILDPRLLTPTKTTLQRRKTDFLVLALLRGHRPARDRDDHRPHDGALQQRVALHEERRLHEPEIHFERDVTENHRKEVELGEKSGRMTAREGPTRITA